MPDEEIPTALIIGASRGLGAALATGLAARGWRVIGTVRGEGNALTADRIEIMRLDMTDAASITALRDQLNNRRIDILFVNAGIATERPFATVEQVSDAEFAHVMATNVLAPLRTITALADLVPADGLIGVMSSGQGSIASNLTGGNDVYRASKAALNMLLTSFSKRASEAQRAFLLLSPGWVKTDMGGYGATYTIAETTPKLVDILLAKRGRPGIEYLDRDGRAVPW